MRNAEKVPLVFEEPIFHYRAYGLNIESEIEIPELPCGLGQADLKVISGSINQTRECTKHPSDRIQTTSTYTLLPFKRNVGADFLISDGREIRVDFENAKHLPKIRLAILGYCLTTILFQRKYFVLHGNALLTPDGAIGICGHQRAGKSTTTMGLYKRGFGVIADDLTAVSTLSNWEVLPGFPRLKLWADTLGRFHESSQGLTRILPDIEKFSFPVDQGFHTQKEILNTIYILKKAEVNEVTTRRLVGIEKVSELSKQIRSYTPGQLPHGSLWALRVCCELAHKINVLEVVRPMKGDSIEQVVDMIEMDQKLGKNCKQASFEQTLGNSIL